MNIHFYILFALTFFTGMAAGAVLYVGAFAPAHQPASPPPVSEREFELRGERFTTGCVRQAAGCDRFTLAENRRLTRTEEGEESAAERVSITYFRELTDAIQAAPLTDIQRESVACQSYSRVGEQYLLIYQGEVYTIHSCSQSFQNDTLAEYLRQLWDNTVATTSAPTPLFEEGVTGSLQRYLRTQFDWTSE